MPNKQYQKGVRFERERVNYYKKEMKADAAWRSAGSHGPADIVVIRKGVCYLIQCKTTDDPKQAERLLERFKAAPPLPHGTYRQTIEIKVTGSKDILSWTH